MSAYAEGTSVSVEKSRSEIESILARYGADRFMYMTGPEGAVICFEAKGRQVKFTLPLPDKADFATRPAPPHYRDQKPVAVTPEVAYSKWEQACRERWRSLLLSIKAKLEAVRVGITSFEVEFMPHFVVGPRGQTVADKILPQLEEAHKSGKLPQFQLLG